MGRPSSWLSHGHRVATAKRKKSGTRSPELAQPATFDAFMDLKFYLEELLGRRVDLVTTKALKPQIRPYVEREAILVA